MNKIKKIGLSKLLLNNNIAIFRCPICKKGIVKIDKNSKFDVILNILSPANYKEFIRVLDKNGIVIKVAPEEGYLQEIRKAIKDNIKKDNYSNKNIVDVFNENLDIIYDKRITYKANISKTNLQDLIKMTPLKSSLNQVQINELVKFNINTITIDLKVIVGKLK